jgi:hypothetical protein
MPVRVWLGAVAVAMITGALASGCAHTPPSVHLPSRPTWEMFPRASSPPADCPGQYRSVIADSSGDVFLGCWGQKTDSPAKASL